MRDKALSPSTPRTALDAFTMPPSAKFLGFQLESIDHETKSARIKFTATDQMLNPAGTVQGGFLTAMLDEAMGSMLVILHNGEKAPVSVDLHMQFLRPGKLGDFVCDARVKHLTKSTAFTEATLYDGANEAIVLAVQTHRLFPMKEKT